MSARGLRKLSLVLVVLTASCVLADGLVIYSSWRSETRAEYEAERTSSDLGVNAVVRSVQVGGDTYYRVAVEVDTMAEGIDQVQAAKSAGKDAWYLSVIGEKSGTGNEPSVSAEDSMDGDIGLAQDGGMQSGIFPDDPAEESSGESLLGPNSSLSEEERISVESTLGEVDDVQNQAQSLISDWLPRGEELFEEIPEDVVELLDEPEVPADGDPPDSGEDAGESQEASPDASPDSSQSEESPEPDPAE